MDQILSSHSEIESVGESEFLDLLLKKDANNLQKLAETYLASLNQIKANCVVNKLPFNYQHIGLILQLFPKAKIIHCKRDWRDTGLSCFFQNFADNHPWSTNIDDIKHYFDAYQKLMAHWEELFSNKILNVDYESMVEDFEMQCRRLIKFVGFPWEDQCLTFYQNKSLVQSASKWQVRQPIHSNSIGRWGKYQSQVALFLK